MPFVSEAQRRQCWVLARQAEKKGRRPKWDCSEWAHKSPPARDLPAYKVYTGPRGGRFYRRNGKKCYLKKNQQPPRQPRKKRSKKQ